jgi:nucleoid-associated protein YgaU
MMRPARRQDLAAGFVAGVGLMLLVAGVPIALVVTVGWPLPQSMPQLETVMAALRYGQIAPTTLLQALALVLWLTWAAITVGIVLEIAAVLRGTVARALPGFGPLQQLAARLVATVMLASSVTTRAAAEPPPVPPAARAPVETQVDGHGAGREAAPPRDQQATSGAWWTVRRHDSLWSIAERTLGDGHRWKEIAAGNIDRRQPDGGRLRRGDTLIRPGWRLELPPEADSPAPSARVKVTAGDDLWSIAQEHLDDGERWREIHAGNRGRRQPDGGRLADPDVIRPGWVLRLPTSDRPSDGDSDSGSGGGEAARPDDDVPRARSEHRGRSAGPFTGARDEAARPRTGPGDTAAASVPAPVTPWTLPSPVGTPAAADSAHGSEPPAPAHRPQLSPARFETPSPGRTDDRDLAPAATAILAAVLIGLLAHRRRHWLRHRGVGAVPAPVDTEAAELERWLRSMADHDLTHRVDRVLCRLTEHFAEHGVAPEVRAVELGEDVVLHVATADQRTPPRITGADGGRRWIVAAELEMAPAAHDRRYVPALISCGRRDGGALLLLDPIAVDGVGVTGPDDLVADAMTSWTTELAAAGTARGVEIVVVGRHHPLVERLARVSIAADAGAALDRVRRLRDAAGRTDARIVVLCGSGVADDDVDALLDVAAHPAVGVVVAGREVTATRLELTGDGVRLWPDDVRLDAPEWLTPDDWDRFGDLLRPAAHGHVVTPVRPALRPVLADDEVQVVAPTEEQWSAHVVGLLGPLTIDDRPPAIDADAAELLTWLAVHRTGAEAGTLLGLLRPGRTPDPDVLEQATAMVDTVLGASDPVVVRTDDGRLELRDTVTTDLARCDELVRGLDRQPRPVQARSIYMALELVRGAPFANSAAWAHADGTALRTAGMIIDISHRLAMQSLTIGDVERAAWAVDRGLLAAPTNELLHRDRMRIADMAGDAAGIDACMRQLRLRVEADGGWLTPETEALYRELRGASPPDVDEDGS